MLGKLVFPRFVSVCYGVEDDVSADGAMVPMYFQAVVRMVEGTVRP